MRTTVAILGALLLLAGCNDDDPSPSVTSAPPADVEGQWETKAFVTMDSCGFNLEITNEAVPVMLHQTGSDVRMEGINGRTGECLDVPFHLDGNIMTFTTEENMTVQGCEVRLKETWTIGFDSTGHFDGTDQVRATRASGECGGFQSCELWIVFEGDRCDGCWAACGRAATTEGSVLDLLGVSQEQLFDAIRNQR